MSIITRKPATIPADIKWPTGYCLDPDGAMCVPEGKYEDWEFGYEVGFAEAMAIKMSAVQSERRKAYADGSAPQSVDDQTHE